MKRKPQVTIRFEAKEHATIKKAAQAERRSVNQFMILAGLKAAKASLAAVPLPIRRADDKPEATA